MSEGPNPPNNTEDTSTASTTSKLTEAKRAHTDKLETAAEAVKKVYNRALEIDGTSVSAVYDVIAVLQYMVKNELKATKTLTTKQYHTIVNLVDMLEGWRDLEDYKAVQDATALSKLMNQNFRDLQEARTH